MLSFWQRPETNQPILARPHRRAFFRYKIDLKLISLKYVFCGTLRRSLESKNSNLFIVFLNDEYSKSLTRLYACSTKYMMNKKLIQIY